MGPHGDLQENLQPISSHSSKITCTSYNSIDLNNSHQSVNMAAELKLGDSIPAGVTFSYVPYTPENGDITACGIPINYDASKEWANKKVVVFSVPGLHPWLLCKASPWLHREP